MKSLFEKISAHLLTLGIGALTPTAAALAIFFRHEITTLVAQSSPQSLSIFLVLLALGCLALLAWVIYLLPWFKYFPKLQVYQHRVNGLYYCPTCRNKKPLSPLKYEKTGWRCPFKECGKFYVDPDYVPPKEKKKSNPIAGW